jgi:ABC-2 type transport system ATP-binding protein
VPETPAEQAAESSELADSSDAQTHDSAAKPDAVLAGLARLRALAAQFATQAPGIEIATPAPDVSDTPATADAAVAVPAAVEPKTEPKLQQKTKTAPQPQPQPQPKPKPKPEPTPTSDGVVAVRPTLSHELEAATGDYVLEVRGLSKGFGDTVAVNDIQLNVRAGVFYGIVGPNGAGKTTTLSMITGLLRPDSGTASVNGVNVWDSPEIAKRSIGVLPDRLRIFDRLTGSQLLYYSGVLRGLSAAEVRKRSADLASAFGLDDVMGRLVSDYSSGMLKKVALAAAMIHSPRLLVLDEPFESVDPVSAATVTRILKQYVDAGGTVLLSSHRMELVQRVCSHVAVIVEGTLLADGTIDQVRNGMSLEDRFVQLTGKNSSGGGLEWLSSFSD